MAMYESTCEDVREIECAPPNRHIRRVLIVQRIERLHRLERRIEQLRTKKEPEDVFVGLVEVKLNTDKTAQADEIWITADVPPSINGARVLREFSCV